MRRPALFSTPPSIAIADEPLGDGAALTAADILCSGDGFQIVPARQARRRGVFDGCQPRYHSSSQ